MRLAVVLAVLVSAHTAAAQNAHDPAAAEALFSAARTDLANGNVREACRKFEESQRLDPAVGTVINLAACLEKLGRLASAWEKWQQAQRLLSPSDERHAVVIKRAKAVDQRVPRLTLRLTTDHPLSTTVLRDGVKLGPAARSVPLPVDPGLHVLVVRAPGHEDRRYEIDLREGQRRELVLEVGAEKKSAASQETPEAKKSVPAQPPPAKADVSDNLYRPPVLGYALLGAGAAAAVVGTIAGIGALNKKSKMDDDCSTQGGQRVCGPAGLDAADSGKTFATVSNVAFVVAAVGLGAGTYFTFFAQPQTGAQSATLRLQGSF